jgi:uncharacterized protein (TIGR02996 family)
MNCAGRRWNVPDPITLTDEFIYRIAPDGKSATMALDLVQRGAFSSPRISPEGTRLQALCQGSESRPYAVEIDLSDPERPRTGCNCFSHKHPCKHALGLLFLAARSPESFEGAAPRQDKVELQGTKVRQESAPKERPPTDVGEALLQAVIAEPEEEAPRLIYADWLDEQGQPEGVDRAAFIQVQIGLAHASEEAAVTRQLRKREQELWEAYKERWLTHLPPHLRKREPRFHRGFLEELSLPPASWAKHGAKLFGQNPIYRVRLYGRVDRNIIGDLVVIPDLTRIREVVLAECDIREPNSTLKVLFDTPFLSGLVRLDLSGSGVSTRELGALLESPVLGRLERLDLSRNRIGPGGAQALAGSPQASSLRRLVLAGNPIGDAGGKALASSVHLETVESLDLSDIELDAKVWAALRDRFGERVVLG